MRQIIVATKQDRCVLAGILIALLQIPTIILLDKTINGSTVYTVVADILLQWLGFSSDYSPSYHSLWPIALALGTAIGVLLVKKSPKANLQLPSWWQGFVGGLLLMLGTRVAGDGSTFEELSALPQLQSHSIITWLFLILTCVLASGHMRKT